MLFDFATSSFVICVLVLKILEIKRFLSLHLVICPSDSLSIYLEHCPLSQSLASTWKQDFKPNLSVSGTPPLHCVIIPFTDYFQPSGIDLELLVPIKKRVKRAYPL